MKSNNLFDGIDIAIIGSGAAGLFCALNIPVDKKVLIITKDEVEHSDSFLAQGGISTLKNKDDYDSYFEDTMRAGRYENNKEAVDIMIKSSNEIIDDLLEYNVEFDMNGDALSYTREGAHSTFRILHHADVTGREITSKLYAAAKERSNIHILEFTTMVDIIEENNKCIGVVAKSKDNELFNIFAKVTVMATGGIGGLFEHSTNFSHLTGDSLAIALRHNIQLQNINYIQIHPTTLYTKKKGRSFLISESVRGEGGILLNPDGERFVNELEPRDVVTEAICKEMKKYNTDHVFLSLAHISKDEILNHFPNIYKKCLEEGYDITKDPVPVTPAQHYFMGGVKVDMNSHTSLNNLYAIGETSCNGVHGANRLASNSLLETLVFAKRAAHHINTYIDETPLITKEYDYAKEYMDINIEEKYKELVLDELKRKDEQFYVRWCNNEN